MSLLVLAKPAFMMIAGMLDVGFTSKTMEQNAKRYAHNELVAKDVEQSQLYQNQLIPSVEMQSDHWQAHTIYKPSLTLAGDWYDVREIRLQDQSRYLAVCLADVVGHGVSAGMVASVVASIWGVWIHKVASRQVTNEDSSIPMAMQQLLDDMAGALAALRQKKDCSAAVLLVNLESGEAHYSTAGHPMMLHLEKSGEPQGLHTQGGRVASGNTFQVRSTKVKASDKLIIYSDGIITHNLPYSVWLRRMVKSTHPLIALANSIRANRKIFTADRSVEDDMTMIVVTIKQIGVEPAVAGPNQSDDVPLTEKSA
jgi:serine phosphatase RsbU (regulator of sigma subunit)